MDTTIITRWKSILWFLGVIWSTWSQFTMCGAQTDMKCSEPLGLEYRSIIADDQITASDYSKSTRKPAECRLNNNKHWTPNISPDSWIQVDFLAMYTISGIRTQGAYDGGKDYVTMLRIQTGETNTSLTYIKDDDTPKEFHANSDDKNTVDITFPESLQARFLRILPTQWNGNNVNLRLEVLGCQSIPASWSEWSAWGDCSVTCGEGKQSRSRTCSVDGACDGVTTGELNNCTLPSCPSWSEWSAWKDCSVTCGEGTKSRSRTCSVDGACDGEITGELSDCTLPSCRFKRALQKFEEKCEMLEDVTMDDILTKWEHMISFLHDVLEVAMNISSKYYGTEIFGDDENYSDVEMTPFDLKISFPENAWGKNKVSELKKDFKSKLFTGESGHNFQMRSRIISLNMFDSNKSKAPYMSEKNFNITFNLLQDVSGDPSCQFLNLDRKWSPDGCVVSEYNKSYVTCSCNHMTSFAVLMQVTEVEISTANQKALSVLTYIILPISILCLAATIILFIVCKIYKKPRIIIHINLAASLLLAQLMFVTGINAKSKGGCIFVTFILHYFWLVVFMWMLVEGVNLFLKVNPHINWKIKLPICAPLAWGLPSVIAFITLGAGISKYGQKGRCWLPLENGLIAAFAVPALLITAVNFVILVIIIHKFLHLKANQDKSEMERVKAGVRAVAILIPLLGLTCIFGMLQFDRAATAFAYLFVFCNGLQGVFIFITQCLLDEDVRVFLKQKVSRGRVDQSNSTADTDTQ